MTSDLIHQLRAACSPESPLANLCFEAADALEREMQEAAAWRSSAVEMQRQLKLAEARLKQAEELLKPFADEAAAWASYKDHEPLVEAFPDVESHINVGHLRAAARFLESKDAE